MLKEVVGDSVYATWLDMLKRLVPQGRTHRVSVILAGMLRYAQEVAYDNMKTDGNAKRLALLFEEAEESYMDDDIKWLLLQASSLLKDARVRYKRKNSRGQSYSIAEEAVYEFLHWEDMPWERR